MTNKTFCILPWTHIHLNTEGDVFPCCVGWNPSRSTRLGWLKDSSFEDLFNSESMKQLRLDMISGIDRPDFCKNCYDREDSGFRSAREGYNSEYTSDEILSFIQNTRSDGYVEPIISSWDMRFSNLCNLKCRTCGPLFSTSWAAEKGNKEVFKLTPVTWLGTDPLINQYKNVKKIYFAGGEPLIMPEHFSLLKTLISQNVAKDISLVYNTNATKLDYNNNDLTQLWKCFKQVTLGLSIDAIGDRAEYIRPGIGWKTIEDNLKRLMEIKRSISSFDVYYSPTVSIFNVWHLTDMHRYLWENRLMPYINSIIFNLLLNPSHYRANILPNAIKEEIVEKISVHVQWLIRANADVRTIDQFTRLKDYMMPSIEQSTELLSFFDETLKLDSLRKQNFYEVFPEYQQVK